MLALALLLAVTSSPPQVCRFIGSGEENPFTRWLSANEVTCATAAAADLENAARVSVLLNSGERGVVYATRDAIGVPVAAGGPTLVPAGQELWLFTIGESGPSGVVTIPPLAIGAERTIDGRQPEPGTVVGWLHVPESDRQAVSNARSLSPPVVRTGNREGDVTRSLANLNGTFVRLRNVPASDLELELGGRGWLPQRRRAKAIGPLTRITEPLLARPSATLLVNWSATGDLAALDASIGTCTQKEEAPPHLEVAIASCKAPERGRPVDPDSCHVIRTEPAAANTFGGFLVEDLYPGLYRAQIRFGKLPPVSAFANASGAQQTSLNVHAAYATLAGSLAKGGETIAGETILGFPGGVGFSKSGEYQAVLIDRIPRLLPPDTRIDVAPCRGNKAVVLTDTTVRLNGRYDIDMPDNELVIRVEDTFTREALAATVRYVLMSRGFPIRPVLSGTIPIESNDVARLQSVPQRETRLSVSAPGYQNKEVERFTLDKSERRTITVQLMPLQGSSGTIVSATPFDSAMVFWFAANGEETEHADIAGDGTFVYARRHDASETMAVVSASHPLWAVKSPALKLGDLVKLAFPDGTSRSFEVVARGPSAFLAVVVGGVRIPMPAFRQHQQIRRLPWTTQPTGVTPVSDIAATGTIEVLLGPPLETLSPRGTLMDLFAFPQFKTIARRLEPDQTSVSFVP